MARGSNAAERSLRTGTGSKTFRRFSQQTRAGYLARARRRRRRSSRCAPARGVRTLRARARTPALCSRGCSTCGARIRRSTRSLFAHLCLTRCGAIPHDRVAPCCTSLRAYRGCVPRTSAPGAPHWAFGTSMRAARVAGCLGASVRSWAPASPRAPHRRRACACMLPRSTPCSCSNLCSVLAYWCATYRPTSSLARLQVGVRVSHLGIRGSEYGPTRFSRMCVPRRAVNTVPRDSLACAFRGVRCSCGAMRSHRCGARTGCGATFVLLSLPRTRTSYRLFRVAPSRPVPVGVAPSRRDSSEHAPTARRRWLCGMRVLSPYAHLRCGPPISFSHLPLS